MTCRGLPKWESFFRGTAYVLVLSILLFQQSLYYQAARSILINDFEGAKSYIEQSLKMWIQEGLTTELLVKVSRIEDAFSHALNALVKI
jgi:hypothetical protein